MAVVDDEFLTGAVSDMETLAARLR
jgi:hypothetical protein